MTRELPSGSRGGVETSKLIPALSAGSTSGLGSLVAYVAFASFIFSGPLQPYASQGIGLVLFGVFVGCLIVALIGGYRGAIAGLSSALVIVMAQIGATMEATGEVLFVTTVVALAIGAAGAGVLCVLIGQLRLSSLVRFIPYPVAGGVVAGIGVVVCLAAMSITDVEPDWRRISALIEPETLLRWGPGAVYGFGLYLAMRRWKNPLILPFSVVLAVGGYHVAFAVLGMSVEEARDTGLLLTSTATGTLWPVIGPADLALVDWVALSRQIPNLLVLAIVALLCVVVSLAGLEVMLGEELDWDREFRAAGSASVIGGMGGGTFVCMIVPSSFRSRLFGASTRVTGVVCALVIGAGLFFGDGVLGFIPVSLIGGILLFAGLGMIEEGLLRSRTRLPVSEFAIVLLIVVVIVAFGLIEGIAMGMLATLVFFALRLSRVDPIASQFTGQVQRSSRVRPPPDRAILLERGERICGYRLRGYLFFGSTWPLIARLKQSLEGPVRPACLILDLQFVSGLDVSAVSVLGRFLQTATTSGVRIVLSASSESLRVGLARNVPAAVFAAMWIEPNEDRALERCEDLIIEAWRAEMDTADHKRASLLTRTADDLERFLERQVLFEELIEEMTPWLDLRGYEPGETLVATGQDELQLLAAGRATAYDATGVRLRQCGVGDLVFPLFAVDAMVASMVADGPCRCVVLASEARQWLEKHEAQLALKLYRYLFASRASTSSPVK